ncbi:hypothetical protein HNY73_014501 [Argiope bruennichi]|uniref:Uncharacterized protein n=1 Tax=Argiope bruennichi TaxID=94029 RepID=A0A8T0EP57_ARGBR|nr:hypothetical protein HNY73_014501 [Argiope bruennichi]
MPGTFVVLGSWLLADVLALLCIAEQSPGGEGEEGGAPSNRNSAADRQAKRDEAERQAKREEAERQEKREEAERKHALEIAAKTLDFVGSELLPSAPKVDWQSQLKNFCTSSEDVGLYLVPFERVMKRVQMPNTLWMACLTVFCSKVDELGCINNTTMHITETPGSKPVSRSPYRASNYERQVLREIVQGKDRVSFGIVVQNIVVQFSWYQRKQEIKEW